MVAKILKERFLPRFFLRRTKDLIKDQVSGLEYQRRVVPSTDIFTPQLPKKTDEVVFCPLTPKQLDVYKRIINSEPVQNLVRKDEMCECGSRKKCATFNSVSDGN